MVPPQQDRLLDRLPHILLHRLQVVAQPEGQSFEQTAEQVAARVLDPPADQGSPALIVVVPISNPTRTTMIV